MGDRPDWWARGTAIAALAVSLVSLGYAKRADIRQEEALLPVFEWRATRIRADLTLWNVTVRNGATSQAELRELRVVSPIGTHLMLGTTSKADLLDARSPRNQARAGSFSFINLNRPISAGATDTFDFEIATNGIANGAQTTFKINLTIVSGNRDRSPVTFMDQRTL